MRKTLKESQSNLAIRKSKGKGKENEMRMKRNPANAGCPREDAYAVTGKENGAVRIKCMSFWTEHVWHRPPYIERTWFFILE